MYNPPLAYFISFRAYGTWLHGDERGSVDRRHNTFGEPMQPPSSNRARWEAAEIKSAPPPFDEPCRRVIGQAIREVCAHRGWRLLELNVRTKHVHVVVAAGGPPEPVMNTFKAWSTRRLREAGLIDGQARVWSRHGSTVYLFRPEKVDEKCRYVRDEQ